MIGLKAKAREGYGRTAQGLGRWLSALSALLEDLGLIPSTHIRLLTTLYFPVPELTWYI